MDHNNVAKQLLLTLNDFEMLCFFLDNVGKHGAVDRRKKYKSARCKMEG